MTSSVSFFSSCVPVISMALWYMGESLAMCCPMESSTCCICWCMCGLCSAGLNILSMMLASSVCVILGLR